MVSLARRAYDRLVSAPSLAGRPTLRILGSTRTEPLEFWWGPTGPWIILALAIIVIGAVAVLTRLHLLGVAVLFWLTFAAGMGVLALSGHAMTAAWHLGPVADGYFWQVLILSPEGGARKRDPASRLAGRGVPCTA